MIYGWDCNCGTRNQANAAFCQQCGQSCHHARAFRTQKPATWLPPLLLALGLLIGGAGGFFYGQQHLRTKLRPREADPVMARWLETTAPCLHPLSWELREAPTGKITVRCAFGHAWVNHGNFWIPSD